MGLSQNIAQLNSLRTRRLATAAQKQAEGTGTPSRLGKLRKCGKHATPFSAHLTLQGRARASIPTKAARPHGGPSPARPWQVLRGQPGPLRRPTPASLARRASPGLSESPPRPAAATAGGPGPPGPEGSPPPDAVSRGPEKPGPAGPRPSEASPSGRDCWRRRQRPPTAPSPGDRYLRAPPGASPHRRAAQGRPGAAGLRQRPPPYFERSAIFTPSPPPPTARPHRAAPPRRRPRGVLRELPRRQPPAASGPAGKGAAAGPAQTPGPRRAQLTPVEPSPPPPRSVLTPWLRCSFGRS